MRENLIKYLRKLYKMANRRLLRISRQIDKHNSLSPGHDGNKNELVAWKKKRNRLHNKFVRWHKVMYYIGQEINKMSGENEPKQYEKDNNLPF